RSRSALDDQRGRSAATSLPSDTLGVAAEGIGPSADQSRTEPASMACPGCSELPESVDEPLGNPAVQQEDEQGIASGSTTKVPWAIGLPARTCNTDATPTVSAGRRLIRKLLNVWSGRPDLNRGPLGPEPSALARLSHAPTGRTDSATLSRSASRGPSQRAYSPRRRGPAATTWPLPSAGSHARNAASTAWWVVSVWSGVIEMKPR